MSFFNWFLDPVRYHYADFSGRATRQQYWMFVGVYILLAIVISILEKAVGLNFLGLIFAVSILVPSLAIASRRLHDTGLSGLWQLMGLVPFLGTIVLIVLLVRKGQPHDNSYGPASGQIARVAAAEPVAESQ